MESENKISFIKKIYNSIIKIEKYPEMASQGLPKAIKYLIQLIIIFSIIVSIFNIYNINKMVKETGKYIENEIPDFSYSQGELRINSEDVITKQIEEFGNVIIDTNYNEESKVSSYINEVQSQNNGIILLKDKIIVKTDVMDATINYTYSDLFSGTGITEFTKQEFINYINGTQMINVYIGIFLILVIWAFSLYLINTLVNVIAISIFGYIVSLIIKMKMNYKAIFNMTIYSITLSTILSMLYIGINYVTGFTIKFFDLMYITVACIYLIAAIFIIKTDFIKRQGEVLKIQEVEKIIKKEIDDKKEEPKEKKEQPKEEKKKENKKENGEDEAEGANA